MLVSLNQIHLIIIHPVSLCVNNTNTHFDRLLELKGQIPCVLVVWWTASSNEVEVPSEVVELSTRHQ